MEYKISDLYGKGEYEEGGVEFMKQEEEIAYDEKLLEAFYKIENDKNNE